LNGPVEQSRTGGAKSSITNSGQLAPEKTPPYLLQFCQHYQDADAPVDDFFEFVKEGWLRAWKSFEGAYRIPADVRRKMRLRQGAAGRPSWASQLHCQLVLISIASSGAMAGVELIVRGVKSECSAASSFALA
jgi:hypothetical protein